MTSRGFRWLGFALLASAGASLLGLTSMMNSAFAFGDDTVAFVMGPSGFPLPVQTYVDNANELYIHSDNPQAFLTPEGLYPITGVNSLRLDPSVTQGVAALNNAIVPQVQAGNDVDVFGFSQSSTVSSLAMPQLMSELKAEGLPSDGVHFILVGDPNNPDGGMLERFVGASIPSVGTTFSGATPSDLFTTDIYTNEYDGFADFPTYPINLLSDLNAYVGILYQHTAYVDLTQYQVDHAKDLGTFGDTTYYMITTENLPLLEPLRYLPFGNPLADLLQPDLSVLVNLGYGNIYNGWDPGNPSLPTPFGLFPTNLNWAEVFTALAAGIPQGISKAISDIASGQLMDLSSLQQLLDVAHTFGLTPSDHPSPAELLGAVATYFNADVPTTPITLASSPTDIVNILTGVAYTDISTLLLPATSLGLALGISLPNYGASLFLDNLEAGNLLGAVGDPIAATVGLLPLTIGLEGAVVGEAFATTVYDLFGGLIP